MIRINMSTPEPEVVKLKNPVTERDHTSGSATAPVTLLEYGNFECIYCGGVYPIIKQVQNLLGDNLRFVFRHFPTVQTHPHSLRAAEAAESAAAQQKFWQMHDELFTHQTALEDRNLSRYAHRIGLNVEKFNHDMTEHSFLQQIDADYQRSLFDEHITGTPTLYLNDVRYTGAADFADLLHAIKLSDTEDRIQLPENLHGLQGVLNRLRRGAKH
ncbi:MAG TPA: thioredoxin domain-containing protein [Pyrinomonadaceae bacterium]|nr:thioredoxin domain-containing protein [Pyrinomonadaceae bacterium]